MPEDNRREEARVNRIVEKRKGKLRQGKAGQDIPGQGKAGQVRVGKHRLWQDGAA